MLSKLIKDKDGDRPLHHICLGCSDDTKSSLCISLINVLLDKSLKCKTKLDLNASNDKMQSCLHIAVNKNCINLVKFLLRNGFKESLYLHDIQGDTPLHDAIRINNEQIIETLLSYDGVDKNLLINATNKDGFNCLSYAVVRENLK